MREIRELQPAKDWLAEVGREPAALRDIDLRSLTKEIVGAGSFEGSLFLGCDLEKDALLAVVTSGGLALADQADFAFPLHRARCYNAAELFDGFDPNDPDSYSKTRDARIYQQYLEQGADTPTSIRTSLARAIHDHSITECVAELLDGQKSVAIMGGHDVLRSDESYLQVAQLSRKLTNLGYTIVSGGGPGIMEASHLGPYMATRTDDELKAALKMLAVREEKFIRDIKKEYLDRDWLARAFKVRQAYPLEGDALQRSVSLGIPTWFYGHEPPAPFATHIGKYFANSIREEGLLMVASHGVIFAAGTAGTTQEIFQDAAQNHYGTSGYFSPMILLGKKYWTVDRPVWPLLSQVAQGKEYAELLAVTDSQDEILRRLQSYNPSVYKKPK